MDDVGNAVVVLVDLPDEHVRAVRCRTAPDGLEALRAGLDRSAGTPYLVLDAAVLAGHEGDVEACSPCGADHPEAVWRPGGRHAATTVRGDDARPPRLLLVHQHVAARARAQGLEVVGPPRERCLADGVQVAWPVEEPQPGG